MRFLQAALGSPNERTTRKRVLHLQGGAGGPGFLFQGPLNANHQYRGPTFLTYIYRAADVPAVVSYTSNMIPGHNIRNYLGLRSSLGPRQGLCGFFLRFVWVFVGFAQVLCMYLEAHGTSYLLITGLIGHRPCQGYILAVPSAGPRNLL